MTALQRIVKEAKRMRKLHPNKYAKWTDYVKAASKAIKKPGKKVSGPKAKAKPKSATHTDKGSHNVKIKVVSGLDKVVRKGKKTSVQYSRLSGVDSGGFFKNMAEVRAANKAAGFYWFSPATMKFFNSKIESSLIGGRYFISSEKYGTEPRTYAIREVFADGDIMTLAKKEFKSKQEAKEYLAKYRKQ